MRPEMESTLVQSLADEAEARLSPQRFMHVLGVTHVAVDLAMRHGLNACRAAQAGLLHDISKEIAPEKLQSELRDSGVEIDPEDLDCPSIWHGIHAAQVEVRRLGLAGTPDAEELAEAVALHSTADAGMGPLAKALFVADFTEPGRGIKGSDELRRRAGDDLDAGYRRCLEIKCEYIAGRGMKLSPRAQRALAEAIK